MVVLGCQPAWSGGVLTGALGRRVGALAGAEALFLVTGGRTWNGVVEADAMRDELVRRGVADHRVLRERCSLTTRDNARLSAELLRRRGTGTITLVTCDWHMARAVALFEQERLVVSPHPVPGPPPSRMTGWHRGIHECVARRLARGAS